MSDKRTTGNKAASAAGKVLSNPKFRLRFVQPFSVPFRRVRRVDSDQ